MSDLQERHHPPLVRTKGIKVTTNNAIDRMNSAAPALPGWVSQSTAVEQARAVAEVQAAVVVAQQCPRNMRRAWDEMRLACSRLSLAERAFYSVPNRGTGPSVHLARELARIWGNLDYGVRELRRDDVRSESEVQAFAWDQETNVRSSRSLIIPHARMKGKNRQPLTDLADIYLNNQNVGARAVRECLFTVLPADFVGEAQDLCRETINKGDGKPLNQRIDDMLAAFAGIGVKTPQIETRLGRKRGHWSASDVADLRVVFQSIKRSETTIDQEFPPPPVTEAEIAATTVHQPASGAAPVTPGADSSLPAAPSPDADAEARAQWSREQEEEWLANQEPPAGDQ